MSIMFLISGVLLSLLVYRRLKNIFISFYFLFVFLFFYFVFFHPEINLSFNVKRRIPLILLVDVSRSMKRYNLNLLPWIKSSDEVFYFSDRVAKSTNFLNREFSAIFDSVNWIKKFRNNSQIILISDLQDNSSVTELVNAQDVVVVFLDSFVESKRTNFFIYDLLINDFVVSGELEKIILTVYSDEKRKERFKVYVDGKEIFYKDLNLVEGLQKVEIDITFGFDGFKRVEFVFGSQRIKRILYGASQKYKVFLGAGFPCEDLAFLRRLFDKLKWIKLDFKVKLDHNERLKIPDNDYDAYVFVNLLPEDVLNAEKYFILSNSLYYFTFIDKRVLNLFSNLTNYYSMEYRKIENDLSVLKIVSGNTYIVYGKEIWNWKLKEALLELKENKFENFWLSILAGVLKERGSTFPLERLNFVKGESTFVDTSEVGEFFYRNIPYTVGENLKESFQLPVSLVKTNGLMLFSMNRISNVNEFVNFVKRKERVVENVSFKVNLSSNINYFFLMFILISLYWILLEKKKFAS